MTPTLEQIHAAISHHAQECESALRAAASASDNGMSPGMVEGFHKLAALHSDDAFAWAEHLPQGDPA